MAKPIDSTFREETFAGRNFAFLVEIREIYSVKFRQV